MPTVSVVIPTHNRAAYLLAALESVGRQRFKDFEVIVVDDGSTDCTRDTVHSIDDSRVHYEFQENAGRSAARNRGLELATGRYFAFLDDDDVYLPHKLEQQVKYLDEHPQVDLIGGSAWVIGHDGNICGIWPDVDQEQCLEFASALYACPLMPSTVMIRRTALGGFGEAFDPNVEPIEDSDFFLRLLLNGSTLMVQSSVVANYRVHPGNSQGDAPHNTRQRLRSLEKILRDPRTPRMVKQDSQRIEAYVNLIGALHAYSTGHLDSALQFLQHAAILDPDLFDQDAPGMVEHVAAFARTFHVADPPRFINLVFDHLPDTLENLHGYRNAALGAYHIGRVFTDQRVGWDPKLSDWVLGVFYCPRLLLNRGVWAILGRVVFGLKTTPMRTKDKTLEQFVELVRSAAKNIRHASLRKSPSRPSLWLSYETALNWLIANRVPGQGVAVADVDHRSYPEVTGYVIPTLLECGERDLAVDLARWLIAIQRPDGGWPGHDRRDASYIFDNGQVMRGLLAVLDLLPEARESLRKAADWMLSTTDADGVLRPDPTSAWSDQFGQTISEDIHLYVLPPLQDAGHVLDDSRCLECVDRSLAYYLGKPDLARFRYLTHFHGYVLEALVDLGFEDRARDGLRDTIEQQRPNGAIPAEPAATWVCSPGLAQLAIVGYKLGACDYADAAFDYLQSLQMPNGGFRGSYGPGAAYGPDAAPSWACKYYLDACHWKMRTATDLDSTVSRPRETVESRSVIARFERATRTARARRDVAAGFRSYQNGDPSAARYSFVRAIREDSSWLRNCGIVSIIVRSTVASILQTTRTRVKSLASRTR